MATGTQSATTSHHHYRSQREGYINPSLRRTPTAAGFASSERVRDTPWQHMTETYTWVLEQELAKQDRRNKKTEKWVLEQQIFVGDGFERDWSAGTRQRDKGRSRRVWEDMVHTYGVEADRWMRQEEEARRVAIEREKAKARIQEELRKIDVRIRQKREAEKRKAAEETAKAFSYFREQERKDRARREHGIVEAWNNYEARWAAIATSTEPLTFSTVAWPLLVPPKTPEDITPTAIMSFLLSPAHSQNQTRKDRLRNAQLRWHPDRFRRLMRKVAEKDQGAIEEGVGIVARCLNDLMAREKSVTR